MERHFTSPPWSIELAPGWSAGHRVENRDSVHAEYVAVVPATGDALLRLTTFVLPADYFNNAERWVEMVAQSSRSRGRPVCWVRCGDFTGYLTHFVAGAELLRGWALRSDSFPLDACYRCDVKVRGRDDFAVDAMLGTLRLHGPAAPT